MDYNYYDDYLMHYGVKGMKWGVRRYQNSDGTLTAKGKKRLANNERYREKLAKKLQKDLNIMKLRLRKLKQDLQIYKNTAAVVRHIKIGRKNSVKNVRKNSKINIRLPDLMVKST